MPQTYTPLSVELSMLAYSTGLLLVLILLQAAVGLGTQGFVLAGSRDELPAPGVFQARVARTVDNHREGLTVFAPLVLVAATAQISNQWTVLGAQLFFYSRVVHAAVYLLGAPVIRPAIWTVGIVGTMWILRSVISSN